MIRAGEIAEVRGDGTVMVLLPSLDGGAERHGPCVAAPRADDVRPRRGDRCVVLEDDRGGLWVPLWEVS